MQSLLLDIIREISPTINTIRVSVNANGMCILSWTQSILLVVLYTLAGGITMELESIGRNIRKFRLMRNLRQEDLAEMAGLSINYVGALERGEKIPSLETFIVLLNALEVSSDMVLSSLLVEKHQADASRLMDRMQNLPAYDIERILAVVDVLIQYSSMDQE